MFCTNCGSKLPDDALFCPDCGEKVLVEDDGNDALDVENTDEDFAIPDIERTVILNNFEERKADHPAEAEVEKPSEDGEDAVDKEEEDAVTGEALGATQILDSTGIPDAAVGSDTVILPGDTVILPNNSMPHSHEPLPREDTQAVFNDIQESLAHPDIDFEHSQGGPGNESTVHMYNAPGQQSMNNDPNLFQNNTGAANGGVPPYDSGNTGASGMDDGNDMDGENGQKPKQSKKLAIILTISACAVVGIAVIIAVVLMFSSMGRQKKAYEDQMNLGKEYMSDSEYDEAIEAFRKAIDIDEDSEDAYVGLADAYIKNKEYRKAAEILQRGSKVTGSKKRIDEKKEELYEKAPELKDEFENNNQQADANTNKPSHSSKPSVPETQTPDHTGNNENPVVPPDTAAPQTNAPETTAPQTNAPQTNAPETNAPQTSAPETTAPETNAPQTQDTQTPETSENDESDDQKPSDGDGNNGQGEVVVIGSIQYENREYYHETKLPNGELGAYTQVKYPYFLGDSQMAKALNLYMANVLDAADVSEEIVKDYTGSEDVSFPLYDKANYEVTYGDHGFVSIRYTYENANIPAKIGGLIFNGTDGRPVGWTEVFDGSEKDLTMLIERYYKPEDHHDMPVQEVIKRISANWNNCYLNAEGLIFIASGDESIEVLIPFSEKDYFKFLSNENSSETVPPEQSGESETTQAPESESMPESESSQTSQTPEITGAAWVVEPTLEFEDMPVIMDDMLRYDGVAANYFPLAVYKKDGKLGFIKYDGTVVTEPIYNMVYGCASAVNSEYTLYASLAGSDLWSAVPVDVTTGQAAGAVHMGHGGIENMLLYSRNDGKVYWFSFDGYSEADSLDSVTPVVIVDDIAAASYDAIVSGEGVVYGLYSPDGTIDESRVYDHIYALSDGRMIALSQGKYGVIDEGGNVVIPFEYEGSSYMDFDAIASDPSVVALCEKAPYPYSEGYIALKKNGAWGYFDTSGNCVTDMVFEEARPLNQGKAFVKINGKWGVIEITPQS